MQVFAPNESTFLREQLMAEVPLEERSIVVFGKEVLQPRLVGWAGQLPYTYSGRTLEPRPFGSTLKGLLEKTERLSGHRFNHALLNYYRDGRDSMGMHSDNEAELGPNPIIASWSLGEIRHISFAEKSGTRRLRLELPSGSLLLMEGDTQGQFRHGLPKTSRPCSPRLNITFRRVFSRNNEPR